MKKPKAQSKLVVSATGAVSFVYDDSLVGLLALGESSIKRVSHVEPAANGLWWADMSPVSGPMLGPYVLRSEALGAELNWLNSNL